MANKISTLIDFNVANAKSNLSALKTSVQEAEGFMGKLSAGASGAVSTLKGFATSPAGIAAVGGAIVAAGTAAFEAVNKFSNLGVEVGNFAAATGLSTEAASRWVEVSGDLGIDAGTLEGAIGKMNKALGNTPGVFEAAGIAIAHTKSGAVDANGTFLNVIEKLKGMKNPAEQAALGAKLLGKGWQSMAELIQQGSGKLESSLAAVSDTKVFSSEEVAKAQKFRDTMADLHDKLEDVAIAAGEKLAPALTQVAATGVKAGDTQLRLFELTQKTFDLITNPLGTDSWLQGAIDKALELPPALSETDRETRKLVGTMDDVTVSTDLATAADQQYADQAANTKRAVKQGIDEMIGKWDELTGTVSDDKSWVTLQGTFADVQQKFMDANTAITAGTDDARQKTLDYKGSLDDVTLSVIDYGKKVLGLPPEKLVAIKTALDEGDLQRAEDMLAILTRNRNVNISIQAKGGAGYNPTTGQPYASGTDSATPGPHLVGEHGPEVVNFKGGESVTPNSALGGDTFHIGEVHVHVQTMPTYNQLMPVIAEGVRRNGPGALKALSS